MNECECGRRRTSEPRARRDRHEAVVKREREEKEERERRMKCRCRKADREKDIHGDRRRGVDSNFEEEW